MEVHAPAPLASPLGRAVWPIAVAGLIVHAVHSAAGWETLSGVVDNGLYNALILLGATACIARAALVRTERWAWLAMGIGLACWSAADIYSSVAYDGEPPGISVADPLYLAFYPAAYTALVLMARERMTRFPAGIWLDGLIAALATAALGAAVLHTTLAQATGGDAVTVAVNLAYPLGDIVLLGAAVGVIALTGWRPERAWVYIAASLATSAVADAVYLERVARDAYEQGTLLDTLWPLAVLLIAQAAWTPARSRVPIRLEGWRLVIAPATFAALAVGIVAYSMGDGADRPAVALAVAALVVTIARMALAQRETIAALRRLHEASLTDSLTGLRNRRALIERLAEPRSEPLLLAIFDLDGFKAYNDRFGHVRGDVLLAKLSRRLADAVGAGRAFRLGGDEFCVLAPTTGIDGDALLAAASAALAENAGGIAISSSYGAAALDAADGDPGHALQLADQRMYAQKNAKRMGAAYAGLLETLYARTPGLRQRTAQVTEIALAAGATLGMDEDALQELRRAVELRDLGLVAIPDGVLGASEPLTQHGRRAVRDHSETAARMIIGAAPELATVARVVRACAERYDGTGRPDGLADGAIPLAARVIAAAEELVLARQLDGRTAAAAYSSIHALAGSALDPAVVRAVGSAVGATRADAGTTGGG